MGISFKGLGGTFIFIKVETDSIFDKFVVSHSNFRLLQKVKNFLLGDFMVSFRMFLEKLRPEY